MAIANFFLAIFCLFSVSLPLLLITRGDKPRGNREFIKATLNPWSQHVGKSKISPVVLSEINLLTKLEQSPEIVSVNFAPIHEEGKSICLETNSIDQLDKPTIKPLTTDDELSAA